MEINRYENEILGVIPTADIVEGRFGLLVSHTFSYDFGSRTDLPGFRIPATAEEAKFARFIITWQVDRREPPIYSTTPAYTYSLRRGFGSAANSPFSATVYMVYPGYTDGATIPSGTPSLAFGRGTYTVASGCYINHASIVNPGAGLIVANTAEDGGDAGKLKYQATVDERTVGTVRYYDVSTGKLTVDIK